MFRFRFSALNLNLPHYVSHNRPEYLPLGGRPFWMEHVVVLLSGAKNTPKGTSHKGIVAGHSVSHSNSFVFGGFVRPRCCRLPGSPLESITLYFGPFFRSLMYSLDKRIERYSILWAWPEALVNKLGLRSNCYITALVFFFFKRMRSKI